MKVVSEPDFDTLYSSAWLDLTKEPVIVSVPERMDVITAADARYGTDVFASPGWRTTGTQAAIIHVPSGWSGSIPGGSRSH